MPTPAQAGAAVATAGVLSAGSYGIYHYSTSGEEQKPIDKTKEEQKFDVPTVEPTNVEVIKDSDVTTTYKTSILSLMKESNHQYLVKPVATVTDKVEETKKQWIWNFAKKFDTPNKPKTDADAPFNTVNKPYSDTDDKNVSLNQACNTAYKTLSNKYVFDNNLFENIKKFCSKAPERVDLSEPKSTPYKAAKTDAPYALGVLTQEEVAKKLVDITGTTNDLWFKWAAEKRLPKTKTNLSSLFAGVKKGVKEGSENPDTSLKHACEEAYKKNKYELTDVEGTGKSTILKDLSQYCASVPIENLTAPNTVPSTEPEGIELFKENDQFGDNHNKDYKTGIIKYIKKENLAKIVKHDHKNNRTWWDWAFTTKYKAKEEENKEKLHTLFKGVTSGYSKNKEKTTQTALNQACDEAYRKGKTEYKFGESEFLLKNIAQFCIKGSEANPDISEPRPPVLMGETEAKDTKYQDKIFKGTGGAKNKGKLVKPIAGDNDLWWEWAYWNLYKDKIDNASADFDSGKVTKGYAKDGDQDKVKALNQVCDVAYQKSPSELKTNGAGKNKVITDVGKFCKYGSEDLSDPDN